MASHDSRDRGPFTWSLGLLAGGALAFAAGKYGKTRQRRVFARELRMLAGVGAETIEEGEQWFVRLPVTPGHNVTLPLGEGIGDLRQARQAVLELLAEGAPPILIPGQETPVEEVVLVRDSHLGWAYHIPCWRCGGYFLPLDAPAQTDPTFVRAMTSHMRPIPMQCLHCLSRAMRSGTGEQEGLWFDTMEGAWQWAHYVDGHLFSFPLGVGYYTPPELLERARRTLMHIGPYDREADF